MKMMASEFIWASGPHCHCLGKSLASEINRSLPLLIGGASYSYACDCENRLL